MAIVKPSYDDEDQGYLVFDDPKDIKDSWVENGWERFEPYRIFGFLFHSSPYKSLHKKGLWKYSSLTPDMQRSRLFGKYTYRVDLSKLPPDFVFIVGEWGRNEEYITMDDIPASAVTLVKGLPPLFGPARPDNTGDDSDFYDKDE